MKQEYTIEERLDIITNGVIAILEMMTGLTKPEEVRKQVEGYRPKEGE